MGGGAQKCFFFLPCFILDASSVIYSQERSAQNNLQKPQIISQISIFKFPKALSSILANFALPPQTEKWRRRRRETVIAEMGNDFYGPNSGAAAQSATATIHREEEEEGGSEIEFPSTSTSRKKKKKEEKFSPLDLMEPFKKEEKEKENPPLPPLRKFSPSKCWQGKKFNHVFHVFHRVSEFLPNKISQDRYLPVVQRQRFFLSYVKISHTSFFPLSP